MNRHPKIGLLPLYLALYDQTHPQLRKAFEPFLQQIAGGFKQEGIEVVRSEICCVAAEFEKAVRLFETAEADLIVTLHLAYSPSAEAIKALCGTRLPVLMLDTTMDYDYGPTVDPARLMYNHGIHGVQDLASLLSRRGRPFQIVAGHVTESNVLARAAEIARAAMAARVFKSTRALRIGKSFKGMSDFFVPTVILRDSLGITVDQIWPADLADCARRISPAAIEAEIARDRERFRVEADEQVHRRSVKVGLALRSYLEANDYAAFSMNFLAFDSAQEPIDTVPFLEACKAMARGIGYAGEGDVLTASLVGALSRGFGRTTFTEIFCPDWKGNSLFLSHMGEINPEVAAEKPLLLEKDFPYTKARNPSTLTCAPRPGPAVLVNLTPRAEGRFRLIVAPVEVLEDSPRDEMRRMIRGWIRPTVPIAEFLEQYSRLGGTHHSALVLGDHAEAICAFGLLAGIECCRI